MTCRAITIWRTEQSIVSCPRRFCTTNHAEFVWWNEIWYFHKDLSWKERKNRWLVEGRSIRIDTHLWPNIGRRSSELVNSEENWNENNHEAKQADVNV